MSWAVLWALGTLILLVMTKKKKEEEEREKKTQPKYLPTREGAN